jgi:hypothetical protein
MSASRGDDDRATDPQTAARILRALAIGGEALWELDPVRGTFTRLCNSLGVSGARDGDVISLAELQETAHPEDRHLIRDGIQACLAEPGAMIEVSYRARGADDRWVWIMVRGRWRRSAAWSPASRTRSTRRSASRSPRPLILPTCSARC